MVVSNYRVFLEDKMSEISTISTSFKHTIFYLPFNVKYLLIKIQTIVVITM